MSHVCARRHAVAGRHAIPVLFAAFLAILGPARADALVRTWIQPGGGNWSVASNWDTGVPGPLDDAVITLSGTYTVTVDVNPTVASLTLGGASGTQTLAANGRTLTINGPSTIGSQGRMTLTVSTVLGTGSLTNNGTLTQSSGNVWIPVDNRGTVSVSGGLSNIYGAFTSGSGSVLTIGASLSDNAELTIANGFTNNGTINLTNNGGNTSRTSTLRVTNGTLINAPGRSINALAGSHGGTQRLLAAELDNQGTLSVGHPLSINRSSSDHVNSGTIDVSGANLTVSQSFTNTGVLAIGSGRTMGISAFLYDGGVVSGTGTLNVGGTVTLNVDFSRPDASSTTFRNTVNGPGRLINNSSMTLSGATINAMLENTGTLVASGSSNFINGALISGPGSVLTVAATLSASGVLTVANGFTNNGTINLANSSGNSSLTATLSVTNGTLVNAPGRSINALTGGSAFVARALDAQIDNQGTLNVGNPLTINRQSSDHINTGTILVTGGNLTVSQGGTTPSFTTSGSITIASTRTMTINASGVVYNGGVVSGAGALALGACTVTLNADFSRPDASSTTFTNSTVNGPGELINNSSMTFSGSTINAPGVENLGTLSATGGSFINGALISGSGSTIGIGASLSSSAVLTVLNGFTNNGTINLINSGGNTTLSASLNVTNGTLVNAPGRSINALAGSHGGPARTVGAQLDNQGTLSVGHPLTINKASANHANSGLIDVSGANLTFTGNLRTLVNSGAIAIASTRSLISNTSGTLFTNAAAGVIRGHGTLNIGTTFTNHGTMAPGTETTAGTLTVTGTYLQTATGVLAIDLGGLTAGTLHDRLNVSGPATLAGTIGATLINGFVPSAGDFFTVMTHGARTGTFDSMANAMGSCLEPNYANSAAVTLQNCACTPPTISSEPVSTAVCADHHSVLFTVVADGTAPLAFQWRKDGDEIAGANAASYSIGLATFTDAGEYDVMVTNACGQEVSAPAVLTILPEGPDITEHPAASAACIGSNATFTVAAAAHMGGALSYQWRKDGDPLPGATASTLVVTVATLGDGGQYDCVVSEAGCGSTTSTPGVLTVKNDPPVITLTGPAEVTIECPAGYVEAGATVSDDCDTGLTALIGGEAVADGEPGVFVVTYDATDSQGNPATQVTRVVRVHDTTPPTISLNGPATMLVECHAEFVDPGTTAVDACDPEATVVVGGDALDLSVPGSYVLTYRAIDDAGNESPAVSRTIEVQDTTAPAITLAGATIVTVECGVGYEELGATVEDACDPTVAVTIGGDVVDASTPDTYIVTYSATDAAGNPATASRTVEVIDSTPPILTLDPTPIVVIDVDCSGSEAVSLPLVTAQDLCDASPTVTHDAPALFTPGTTQVTYTARDDAANETTATVDVTVQHGSQVEVLAAQHTVGQGTRPSTTKSPLAGILVRAYERGPGSCIDQQAPAGASWNDYPAIVANCTPINTGTTDATGKAVIDLPAGDYLLISHLVDENTYMGEWANNLGCGETMTKRLQLIVANNTRRPGKTTRLTGSELLIIEPEYVIWDDSTQVYPFVLESVGNWGVTASVAPPDGFVSDYPSLSAQVQSEIEAVQFTITEVGSDLVPTRTTFQVIHGNRRHTVRSEVGLLLTPDYARARGFDVAALEAQGLIVHPDQQGGGGRGRFAGAPEQAMVLPVAEDEPKNAAGSDAATSAAASAQHPATTANGKSNPAWAAASVLPAVSGRGLAAWPSPFSGNGALQVAFGLPDGSLPPDLELGLFDVLGRRVASIPTDLALGRDGVARLAWDADELRRGDVAPGVYFLQALAPSVGMRAECKLVVTR